MTPADDFAALRARATEDQEVLGVVLSGSQAREGTSTSRSDHDVLLVVADGAGDRAAGEARRDARLDVTVMPLTEFRAHALPGSDTEWNRAAFTRARVLKDTEDGLIAQLVADKGRLAPHEAEEHAPGILDAFLNSVYRCLKNDRDGNTIAAQLDAAETVPFHLAYVFALHERVRPYNKYLSWELLHEPLSRTEWAHDHLLGLLADVVSPRYAAAVRQLFNELEPHARAAGHGHVLDSWGEDVLLMRGGTAASPQWPAPSGP